MRLLEQTIAAITPPDATAAAAARARQQRLTKPPGSLGRLEELSVWLAGVRGVERPAVRAPVVVVAAADHGVARAGVSAYPPEVTGQMVQNFLSGGAAVNVLARQCGARVVVVDSGISVAPPAHPLLVSLRAGNGTADISRGAAMSRDAARFCIEHGIGLVRRLAAEGVDLVALGEMGIGNTTASAAIVAACTGLPAEAVTGPGTGLDETARLRKAAIVEQALRINRPDPTDGVGLLAAVGGFEIGLLAGVALGAAALRLPVILDGFITGAAALIARVLCPAVCPYLLASHQSVEPGHRAALDLLGLVPLLDLGLRLGEGSGALLAVPIVSAAAALLDQMATFDEAGVTGSA